ncbi:hypothetical protein GGX14DRAFT_606487 [Mycena pura]|uniref:C2 domain-containing protein n=1 Tax=Mycena pura TaxID=153505 RepID=A0AAD6Y3K8_9AGAR|nr:hypothetical protein GGX14DRAFT_606487 [Mycena pura]
MSRTYSLRIQSADRIVWNPGLGHRKSPNLYVTIDEDGSRVVKTPIFRRSLKPQWDFRTNLTSEMTSKILVLRLHHDSSIGRLGSVFLGECNITIEALLQLCVSNEGEGPLFWKLKVHLYCIGKYALAQTALQDMQKDVDNLALGETGSHVIRAAEAGTQVIDAAEAGANTDLATVLMGVISPLKLIVEIGNELAKVHPYANAAWKILTSVYNAVEHQRDVDDKIMKLVSAMVEVYSFVEHVEFLAEKIIPLESTIAAIAKQTLECAIFVREYTGHGFSGRLVRTTLTNNNDNKLDELSSALLKLKESFDRGVAIQSTIISAEIRDDIKVLVHSDLLKTLSLIDVDASLRPECLLGTRLNVLKEITEWVTTPSDTSNIFWLYGVAGSGKSTIATTVAQSFRELGRLGAFIFFNRNNPASGNPKAVLHTIAYWMAKSNSHVETVLCDVLAHEPTLLNASLRTQFNKLLLDPLVAAKDYICGPIVIILDALDECSNKDGRSSLISLIVNDFPNLPAIFRFVITSRPDSTIAAPFRKNLHITPRFLDISSNESQEDIALYVRYTMANIRTANSGLQSTWPGGDAMTQLTERSGGLFIWASTGYKFINRDSPENKLKMLLDPSREFTSDSRLDELYTTALENSADWSDEDFCRDAIPVLGLIVLGRAPLTAEAMDSLLDLKQGRSSKLLRDLGCIVQWESGQTARMLHGSFSEYLTDPDRSGAHPWFVDKSCVNRSLTLQCFRVLHSQLKFNICDLENWDLLNSGVPNLSTRVEQHISCELSYASKYWASHLHDIVADNEVLTRLRNFMGTDFLHWLEVLSLTEQVSIAQRALEFAQTYAQYAQRQREATPRTWPPSRRAGQARAHNTRRRLGTYSTTGIATIVLGRLSAAPLQYLMFSKGWAVKGLVAVGLRASNRLVTSGPGIAGLGPVPTLLTGMYAVAGLRHVYWALFTNTYDLAPGSALMVVVYNAAVDTFSTLVAVNALTSAPYPVCGGDFVDCIGWKQWAGLALFATGISIELLAEESLGRKPFKKDPKNKGKIDDTGQWSVVRHPDYIGYTLWRAGIALTTGSLGATAALTTFSVFQCYVYQLLRRLIL